jgi:hypothetical protein
VTKKTTKPISILVINMEETPALVQLKADGHTVRYYTGDEIPDAYDAVIGPKCWRYLPDISDKWLPLLLKEARAAQPVKPKKGKKSGAATS